MKHDFSMNRRALLSAGLGLAAVAATPSVLAGVKRKGFFASHGLPIGVQLFTFGDAAVTEDLEGTLKRVAAIGYRTIEIGIGADEAAKMRAAADKAGLAITSLHVAASPAQANGKLSLDDTAQLAAVTRTLGCRDVVVPFPLLPEIKPQAGEDLLNATRRAFRTETDHWKRTAVLLNERGAALRSEGLTLSYHNHNVEFMRVGETSGWEILEGQTDPALVFFEVDVGWVATSRLDPVTVIEGLTGRIRALHVKDIHAPAEPGEVLKIDSTEVGNGVIDWAKVLPAAYRAGTRQFYVEQEPPFKIDRFEAAARSHAFLSRI